MDADTLKTVFEINSLPTGSIQAVYSFDSGSGCLIFNDYYPTGEQVYDGDVTRPVIETSPAVSISCSSNVVDNLGISSGVFKETDVLEVVEPLATGNWTFFVDYNEERDDLGNVARVMVSTMNQSASGSGFNFGFNASNRPYFEYIDSNNIRQIHTHSKDVGINNLVSVSQNLETVSITNHDIGSFEHESEEFEAVNFVEADALYVGNFKTGVNLGYQGFSGSMDSFILYKESLTLDTQNTIAENYFYSGIQSGSTSSSLVSGLEVTGVEVNLSGLTGTGITGYISTLYKTVESCLCGDINFYKDSGVSGELFGQVVTYLTGSGYITGSEFTDIAPTRISNYNRTLKYAEKGITFLNKVPTGSAYEVYSFSTFHGDALNSQAQYKGGVDYFYTNTGYQSGNLNVFVNGLAKYSGTDFNIVSSDLGEKNISFTPAVFNSTDVVIFDRISGSQESVYTFSGFTVTGLGLVYSGSGYTSVPSVVFSGGENTAATATTGDVGGVTRVIGLTLTSGGSGHVTAPTVSITGGGASIEATGEAFIDQNNYIFSTSNTDDPYLNGYKLLSGSDYTQTASNIALIPAQVQKSQYATGNIIFLPRINSNYTHITGTANQFVDTQTALIEEQVWLNGKRLVRDQDYIRVSNIGLLRPPIFITGFSNIIYNNDDNFFNT